MSMLIAYKYFMMEAISLIAIHFFSTKNYPISSSLSLTRFTPSKPAWHKASRLDLDSYELVLVSQLSDALPQL